MEEFSINKIREIRIEKKISQLELANIANFSQSFLANVESGKKAEVEMFTKILFILTIVEIILIMDKESLDL